MSEGWEQEGRRRGGSKSTFLEIEACKGVHDVGVVASSHLPLLLSSPFFPFSSQRNSSDRENERSSPSTNPPTQHRENSERKDVTKQKREKPAKRHRHDLINPERRRMSFEETRKDEFTP